MFRVIFGCILVAMLYGHAVRMVIEEHVEVGSFALQDVNKRLMTASNERSEYRRYLLEAQQELQQTRAELLEWSEGLVELKSVMEGLDEDLSDLFGPGEYSEAVTEALSAAASLGSGAFCSSSRSFHFFYKCRLVRQARFSPC
jgi:hypothetical protein